VIASDHMAIVVSLYCGHTVVTMDLTAGIKWRDMDTEIQSISGSLKDFGLNPDVVLESLLLERGKSIR